MIVALVLAAAGLFAAWAALEVVVRLSVGLPLRVDFYGSIPRSAVRERQGRFGVRVASCLGWAHLGWIAAPDMERYRVERWREEKWQATATLRFGSFLLREGGRYRVVAVALNGGSERVVGEAGVDLQQRFTMVHHHRRLAMGGNTDRRRSRLCSAALGAGAKGRKRDATGPKCAVAMKSSAMGRL